MRIYGLVPARSGSKGLPDKNIRPIAGHPLLAYAIAFGKALGLERVIVSTDSVRYAEIARAYGGECPVLRSAAASADTAMEEDILADLDRTLEPAGVPLPDLWVWLRPTAPFRSLDLTHAAIKRVVDDPSVEAVQFAVVSDPRLHTMAEDGRLDPWTPDWNRKRTKMRRTEFPPVYAAHNVDVSRHQVWREQGQLYLGRPLAAIGPAITGLDIDDLDSFDVVRSLIEAKPMSDVVARHIQMP
jgi:CMP-N,N'-diacetyllegionaminic acid synthase